VVNAMGIEPYSKSRSQERYDIIAPALILNYPGENETEPQLLLTRDVSIDGAYFYMRKPHVYAGPIELEILFKVNENNGQKHHFVLTCSAEVIRCDDSGFAVHFRAGAELAQFALPTVSIEG
jgi:hypothetical protein